MAKGGSEFAIKRLEGGRSPVNTDVLWPDRELAESQVLRIQIKLHQWAIDDPDRRFDDLFNLVCNPAVLVVAWARVRGNRGKRAAGVDGLRPQSIFSAEEEFLPRLRHDLKARLFAPLPVRERMIPKPGSSKLRRLGIPTARDRTVQAALKLVLEPIFEADFKPCSYGFRPRRRAQDAIAEIHQFSSRSYEWVLEGDIEACFDMIDHPALMNRVRSRVGDKRVLAVVKAFLHAGVLGEDGTMRDSTTGTPQGGILSPLLANVALSVLDEHFAKAWRANSGSTYQRTKRRRAGLANYRIVRYADDFVVLVSGTQAHAETVSEDVAAVLAPMGLRLSEAKTKVCHIDGGFDFLGFRIPAETETRHNQTCDLHLPVEEGLGLHRRAGPHAHPQVITSDPCGPAAPAQPGPPGLVHLLSAWRVEGDLRLPRPVHLASGGPVDPETTPQDEMGRPLPPLPSKLATGRGRRGAVPTPNGAGQPLPLPGEQYRYTLADKIIRSSRIAQRHGLVESRMRGDAHVRFGGRDEET